MADKANSISNDAPWRIMLIVVGAALAGAPILATMAGGIASVENSLRLISPVGLRYVSGTLILCLGVGVSATIIGAGAAMLVTLANFPGRRFFAIALALPFAIPAYVAAYAYGDFLGPFGLVSELIGARNLPEIRSMPGAIFVLALMTYPYVYLPMCAALSARSDAYMEAARSLGASPGKAALKVLFAISRPALAGGLALALMETAADYGVADYFGVQTLSVGIFRTWQGLGDLAGATQLAVSLVSDCAASRLAGSHQP